MLLLAPYVCTYLHTYLRTSQCRTLVRTAYTVVRAMCQINGGGSFSIPLGSESPVPIHLKFGMFDYVHSPTSHAKYGGRCKWGGWGGHILP